MQQDEDKEDVAVEGRQVEDVVALTIGQGSVCAIFQEEMYNVEVALLRRPHCWSSL